MFYTQDRFVFRHLIPELSLFTETFDHTTSETLSHTDTHFKLHFLLILTYMKRKNIFVPILSYV